MTFIRRRIDVTISLASGALDADGNNSVTITGHRIIANMGIVGGNGVGSIVLRIFGLPVDMINRLTSIGALYNAVNIGNKIQVAAGNDGQALATIFNGAVLQAYGDFQNAPDVSLVVVASSQGAAALQPIGANTYIGATDVATIMQNLASQGGFNFENNAVNVKLYNPYFYGSVLNQIQSCARAANINYVIDRQTLAIWPKNAARKGDIQVLSASTGMIGYPVYASNYILVNHIFLPNAIFGGKVNIQSSITPVSGTRVITLVTHSLQSEVPGGDWMTQLQCAVILP
ncbi:MAG: hypothetical protein KGI54_14935 [Pseudomonadota bacterium]|nr:hypothetical protein [Pseudomonadota bacterium]